jgi:hypothetical protein
LFLALPTQRKNGGWIRLLAGAPGEEHPRQKNPSAVQTDQRSSQNPSTILGKGRTPFSRISFRMANKKATTETFRAAPTRGTSRERLQSSLVGLAFPRIGAAISGREFN